jgi:small redox-active disulfide protein 2
MEIKIYGSGCSKCIKLASHAEEAAAELGIDVTVTKITDTGAIIDAGVLKTPALGIGDEILMMGRVGTREDVESLLRQAAGQ